MLKFIDFLKASTKLKCEIHIKIDEDKKEAYTEVKGNTPSVLTGISILASNLKDKGVSAELIEGAVEIGLKDNKVEKKTKIIEKEIIIDDEAKARKIEKFLKEWGVK
ncbi:MAG: hypothetical protein HFJ48_06335 [Clostridia bacterium]|nr:hypothetical protein [Clostridia bacterium]